MIKLENLHQSLCEYKRGLKNSSVSISVSTTPSKTDFLVYTTTSSKTVCLSLTKLIEKESKGKFIDEDRNGYLERKKLVNFILDGTLEETKVWLIAFKVFNPKVSLIDVLLKTVDLQNISKAKFLIEEMKADPNEIIDNAGPLLQYAAKCGNFPLVKYLVEVQKVNIEARGILPGCQDTALSCAAYKGHYEVAQYLTEKEASTNPMLSHGRLMLNDAVYSGSLKMVQLLAEKGAEVVDREGRSWALHRALEHGNLEIVQYLLQKKANINEVLFEPAITTAAKSGNLKLFKYLSEELHLDVVVPRSTMPYIDTFSKLVINAFQSGDVDLVRHLVDTYKINIEEYSEEIHSYRQTLPMFRFFFEENKLNPQTLPLEKPSQIELRAYLLSISTNKSLVERQFFAKIANGLASLNLKELKRLYDNRDFTKYDDKEHICLAARHKIVQLYFVKPLFNALENKCSFDLAEKICSYLDFSKMAVFHCRFSYDGEKNKEFFNRVLLGMPERHSKQAEIVNNVKHEFKDDATGIVIEEEQQQQPVGE